MRRLVSKVFHWVFPQKVLEILFPSRYKQKLIQRRFETIEDKAANRSFDIYIREDSMIEPRILSKGLYNDWEKESLKIWAELSKNANTIIDIGANTGIYSLIAQSNNPNAKVIAIEPIEINFDVLKKNITQNKFPIHAEQVALSDKEGTAQMFMLKDKLNYMTSVNDNRYALHPEIQGDSTVVEIQVPLKPFLYIYNKYDLTKIDLIKIDVEGHEMTVLSAMLPYLRESRPLILIEVIGDDNAEQLDTLFRNLNYRFISINEAKKSVVAQELWDNDHHNFLVCHDDTIQFLRRKDLVA